MGWSWYRTKRIWDRVGTGGSGYEMEYRIKQIWDGVGIGESGYELELVQDRANMGWIG